MIEEKTKQKKKKQTKCDGMFVFIDFCKAYDT